MKFTIITPSYNQGQFLEETIQSVIQQDYPDMEYFVVDGGSSDNSVEIIKRYQSKINWWVSEKDKGQTHAINKGISRSTGDWIIWINSDDVLLSGALKRFSELITTHPDVLLFHGESILFGNGKEKRVGTTKDHLDARYLAYIPFPQPSSCFAKKVIENELLDENLKYAMDYELLLKICCTGGKIFKCDDLLSRYRMHPDSKSNHPIDFLKEWSALYSRFLRSVPGAEKFISGMKTCQLYNETDTKFECRKIFDPEIIHQSFKYHLLIHLHTSYQNGNRESVDRIGNFLKENESEFYRQERLGAIMNRNKFIPAGLLRFFRKLKNS